MRDVTEKCWSSSLKNSDLASFVSNVTWNNYSFLSGWWGFLVEGGGSTHSKVSIDWQNRKTRTNIRVLRQVFSKRATFCLNRYDFRRSYWAGYFIVQIDTTFHRKSTVVSFLQPNKKEVCASSLRCENETQGLETLCYWQKKWLSCKSATVSVREQLPHSLGHI
jgi:hypothetical protein